MNELIMVYCDDWCGLYLHNDLIFEGHHFQLSDVRKIEQEYNINFKNLKTTVFLDDEKMEDFGFKMPRDFEELNGYLDELE